MKILISTDSTSDIPLSIRNELSIESLPLTVSLGDTEWLDGVTITPEEFYKVLEENTTLPQSSAIPPSNYTELFLKAYNEGYTHIIHTAINSLGSSTCQNAIMAKEMFYEEHPEAKDKLEIIIKDSLTYSMGYGYAVIEAAKMARDNKTPEEITAFLDDWISHVLPTCITLDLKCVKKSGRISAAAAFVGEAIGLKPIIRFEGGEAHIIAKARGEKKGIEELFNLCAKDRLPGSPYVLILGNNEKVNSVVIETAKEVFGQEAAYIVPVGCIISLNTGPNMAGIIIRS